MGQTGSTLTHQASFAVDAETDSRITALHRLYEKRTGIRMSRATVLRAILEHGLEALEADSGEVRLADDG